LEKLKVNKRYFLLIILIWFFCVTIPGFADDQREIQLIDIRAERITLEKKSIRDALRNEILSDKKAEEWFDRFKFVNAQIRRAINKQGGYATFSKKEINKELQSLKQERANVLTLNGGVTIGGKHYSSMSQLQESYNIEEKQRLNERYQKLDMKLAVLDKERDELSKDVERQLKSDTLLLDNKKEEVRFLQELVDDDSLFFVKSYYGGTPLYVTKKMIKDQIKQRYIEEVYQGKKFNARELESIYKQSYKQYLEASNRIKEHIKEKVIPGKQKEIADLQRKVADKPTHITDISGCWMIFKPGFKNIIVNIIRYNNDVYDAFITDPGDLKDLGHKHHLFRVEPKNNTVFVGKEYSTDARGNHTTTLLRLFINKRGDRMNYRSDDSLSMGRCN